MKRKEMFLAVTGIIIVIGLILSANNSGKPIEKIGYSMDTQVRIVVYDNNADKEVVESAYKEMVRLDKLLSNFNETSETVKLNNTKQCEVSAELKEILNKGIEVSKVTDGAFDLTIYPLTKMWHYKNLYVPSDDEISEAQKKIDRNNIVINENKVILLNEAEIDVSSVAKGYIADKILEFLKENGIKDALVDAGGNIKVMGSPLKKKTEGFIIGIQDPAQNIGIPLGQLKINDESVVTSGIYERNFEKDDEFYHHIIDPKTGYPAKSDVVSVSVICKDSASADAYATAIVVMGSQKGLELVNGIKELECIIVKEDNTILLSDGIENFELASEEYKLAEE